MELNKEKLYELTEKQFTELLYFFGIEKLKHVLYTEACNFPKNSKYYFGPNSTGTFWSGFRKDKMPDSRVIKFYIDEVLNNKSGLDTDFFFDLVDDEISQIEDFSETFILSLNQYLSEAFCILYDIEFKQEASEYIKIINLLKEEKSQIIQTFNQIKEDELAKLNSVFITEKSNLENTIKELKAQITALNKSKMELINKVINNPININSNTIKSMEFDSINQVINYLNNSFTNNKELLASKDYSALANELTIQYILAKILEGETK